MIVTDIKWDTDGELIDTLPTEVKIDEDMDFNDIADFLSDEYGFCIVSFLVESNESSIKEKERNICEDLGWAVCDCGDGTIELSIYSPAGEDFMFYVNGGDDFKRNVRDFYQDFDIDEHVQLWVNSAGTNGVPSTVELVKDAYEIQNMLKALADALYGIDTKETDEPKRIETAYKACLELLVNAPENEDDYLYEFMYTKAMEFVDAVCDIGFEFSESETICDHCIVGRRNGCPHSRGRHYDIYGEGVSLPPYCPNDEDDALPF